MTPPNLPDPSHARPMFAVVALLAGMLWASLYTHPVRADGPVAYVAVLLLHVPIAGQGLQAAALRPIYPTEGACRDDLPYQAALFREDLIAGGWGAVEIRRATCYALTATVGA